MPRLSFFITGFVFTACTAATDDPAPEDEDFTVDGVSKPDRSHDNGVQHICNGGGTLDFKITGTDLSAYEGKRVVGAAIENTGVSTAEVIAHRRVLISSVIEDGEFV